MKEACKVYAESQNSTRFEYARFASSLTFSVVHEVVYACYIRDKLHEPEEYSETFWSLEQQHE
jgi:hypothetical protein